MRQCTCIFYIGLAALPVPAEVHLNVLAHPSSMHLFAFVTTDGQVTTILHFFQTKTRNGQPKTQWTGQKSATDMDWTEMRIRTVEQPPNMFNIAPPQPSCRP